jgi:hypothetical protein
VRAAHHDDHDDIPWLLAQLRVFDEFAGLDLMPDDETATGILLSLLAFHPFFVAEQSGERIGFIAGALHPHPYNPRVIQLTETFWWVDERYRGGRAGLALLDAFDAFGDAHAHQMVMTREVNSPINDRVLVRRGYRLHEMSYLRRAPWRVHRDHMGDTMESAG